MSFFELVKHKSEMKLRKFAGIDLEETEQEIKKENYEKEEKKLNEKELATPDNL